MNNTVRYLVKVERETIERPPVVPTSAGALLSHWLLIAVGAVLIGVGITQAQLPDRLLPILFGISIITVAIPSMGNLRHRAGEVRLRKIDGGITFESSALFPVLHLVAGVSLLALAGVYASDMGAAPTGVSTGRKLLTAALFGALGGWGVLDAVGRLRGPRGLHLSPGGVSWHKLLRRVDVPWEAIEEIALAAQRREIVLAISATGGRHTTVYPMMTGSDNYVIAQVLGYYVHNPGAREQPITVESIGKVRPLS